MPRSPCPLSPLRGGSGASPVVTGGGMLHHGNPVSETNDDLHNNRIGTYAGFADGLAVSVAEEGATSSFIIKDAMTAKRRKMDKRLELGFSDDDDDTMTDPLTRIQEWVQHQSASFSTGSETFVPCKDTFDTFNDTSSSLVTPTVSSMPDDESDFSVRNETTLEQSMAELQAAMDATNFPSAFQNYEKKRAERRQAKEAGRQLKIVEEPETQDSTREEFFTPEATPSQTNALHTNFMIESSLGKESMFASVGTDEHNKRLQFDSMDEEVNHTLLDGTDGEANNTHRNLLRRPEASVSPTEKVDKWERFQESGRLPPQQTDSLQPPPTGVDEHEGRKIDGCPVCENKFKLKTTLVRRLFVRLNREEQAEVKQRWRDDCSFCNKGSKSSSDVTRHVGQTKEKSTHTQEKTFHRDQCGKQNSKIGHLKEHKRRLSVNRRLQKENSSLDRRPNLNSNNPTTSSNRKISCKTHRCHVCRKTFSSKYALSSHRFTHLSEDEKAALVKQGLGQVCFFCDKKFPQKYSYHAHLATHTKEKPFRCYECGQAFSHKHHMLSHKKAIHRKLKEVACPECPKTFGTKGNMLTHLNSMHLKVRHPCPHCSLIFAIKCSFAIHLKKVHP